MNILKQYPLVVCFLPVMLLVTVASFHLLILAINKLSLGGIFKLLVLFLLALAALTVLGYTELSPWTVAILPILLLVALTGSVFFIVKFILKVAK